MGGSEGPLSPPVRGRVLERSGPLGVLRSIYGYWCLSVLRRSSEHRVAVICSIHTLDYSEYSVLRIGLCGRSERRLRTECPESCHGETRREGQKQAMICSGRVEPTLVTIRYRRMDDRKINKPSGTVKLLNSYRH